MKNIFLLVLTIGIVTSTEAMHKQRKHNKPQQDTLIPYLSSMNLIQFSNLPIDSFIAKIPQTYTSLRVLGGDKADYAGVLSIKYSGNVFIHIRVIEFTHLDPTNPNKLPPDQRWSTTLMRKEKIYSIGIYNGVTSLNSFNED